MGVETIKSDVGMSWKKLKLGDIFEIARGGSPRPIETFLTNDENGVNWIMIGDTKDGGKYIEKTAKKIRREGVSNSRMVKEGDFLLTNSMSFGRPYILKTSGCIHDGWLVLSPKDENISRDYFYYYLGSDEIKQRLSSKAAGAVVKNLNKEIVSDLEIELPPLSTQKRIAEILDAADALRRKDQELLKKYDELAQAIFIDMFGDPVKNEKGWDISVLEDLCIDIVDCPHTTPNHTEEITNFPCIRTSEMKNGNISWGSMKYLNKEEYSKRVKRLVPEAGDIVYAREGTYGEAVLLPENYHFALGQRTMLLRPNSNLVSNEFLWYQINSDFVYRQAKRKNMGSTVGHVNVADVKKFDILVPPVQLQLKFTDKITNLISAKSLFENQESDKLFNSLIQNAFKGELVA